jgi:hypothetical protein
VDINHHTGSGTYAAWVVNVGGVTPATSVAWGAITGTLSSQTDLQNALDLKLAATTAASTYATILEPSVDGILTVEPSGSNTATLQVNQDANNYIHLRAGAGQIAMIVGGATKWFFNDTYLQFPGGTQQTVAYPGSSGFLLKADNLSGLADTAVSRTNLGLGTMAVETASNYLTTASASSTYFTIANAANKADLASPTFTGTPSLPTGTTGVTQTAGNNTTALATTAFVTAAVPAIATASQARSFTSNTTAMSPRQALWSMLTPDVNNVSGQAMTTTNVGTIAFVQNGMLTRWVRPGTAGACSSRTRSFGPSQVDQVITATSRTSPFTNIGFSQRIILSGRSIVGGVNEANLTVSIYIGKDESNAVGDLTRRGIGWKMTGGAGSRFLLLQAHNGTTLSSVTSSYAVPDGVAFDWDVESDGAGNVTLYVNGSSVATSTGGPTGNSSGNLTFWNEEISASAALTSQYCAFINSRSKFAVINSW